MRPIWTTRASGFVFHQCFTTHLFLFRSLFTFLPGAFSQAEPALDARRGEKKSGIVTVHLVLLSSWKMTEYEHSRGTCRAHMGNKRPCSNMLTLWFSVCCTNQINPATDQLLFEVYMSSFLHEWSPQQAANCVFRLLSAAICCYKDKLFPDRVKDQGWPPKPV